MRTVRRTLSRLAGAAALVLPLAAAAQSARPAGPPRPAPERGIRSGVSRLIDARRELDLTSRQIVQLDSLERIEFAARRQTQERMALRRDSLMRERESLRGIGRDSARVLARRRIEEMQPQLDQARRRDSASMAAAERILTEPQRQKLREMRAEERGRLRGLQEARMRDARGGMVRGRMLRERQSRERTQAERQLRERPGTPPAPGGRGMRRPDAG